MHVPIDAYKKSENKAGKNTDSTQGKYLSSVNLPFPGLIVKVLLINYFQYLGEVVPSDSQSTHECQDNCRPT